MWAHHIQTKCDDRACCVSCDKHHANCSGMDLVFKRERNKISAAKAKAAPMVAVVARRDRNGNELLSGERLLTR